MHTRFLPQDASQANNLLPAVCWVFRGDASEVVYEGRIVIRSAITIASVNQR